MFSGKLLCEWFTRASGCLGSTAPERTEFLLTWFQRKSNACTNLLRSGALLPQMAFAQTCFGMHSSYWLSHGFILILQIPQEVRMQCPASHLVCSQDLLPWPRQKPQLSSVTRALRRTSRASVREESSTKHSGIWEPASCFHLKMGEGERKEAGGKEGKGDDELRKGPAAGLQVC